MNQTPQADFRVAVRIQIFSDPEETSLEVAAVAENALFRLPPAPGDHFIPGQLSKALLAAGLQPIVKHIEHAPGLPFKQPQEEGYACVVIYCTSSEIPSDTLINELKAEGWAISDFREQNARRRSRGW